jgi:hypothetical protein
MVGAVSVAASTGPHYAFPQLATYSAHLGRHHKPIWTPGGTSNPQMHALMLPLVPSLQASPVLRPLLERVVLLYGLYRTEQDLGWLLGQEMLPPAAGRAVSDSVRRLCAELAPHYK